MLSSPPVTWLRPPTPPTGSSCCSRTSPCRRCWRAGVAQARVLAASGQPDAAVAALEAFVDGLASTELPWLRVMVQLELVRVREQAGDPAAAAEAAAVAEALESFDVVITPADVGLLERLTTSSIASASPAAELTHQGKWWTVDFDGAQRGCPTARGCVTSPSSCRGLASSAALDLVDRVEEATGRLIGAPRRCRHGARHTGSHGLSASHRATPGGGRRCARRRTARDGRGSRGRVGAARPRAVGGLRRGWARPAGVVGGGAEATERPPGRCAALSRMSEAVPGSGMPWTGASGRACTVYEPAPEDVRWTVS